MNIGIVIANNHYNALGVIRSLGENGTPVCLVLTTTAKTYIEKSKYVSFSLRVTEDEPGIVGAIKEIANNELYTYYIFPTTDVSSAIIDSSRDCFMSNVISPNMNGRIRRLQDKSLSKELALQAGFMVPYGKIFDGNSASEFAWDVFPCILKPLASSDGEKSDIVCANSQQELNIELMCFKEKNYSRVLVEEFIQSSDECMLEIMGYCSPDSNPHICGLLKKLREFPNQNGSTSYALVIKKHIGLDMEIINKYLSLLQFNGIFDLELKYAGGKVFFIECNFRNGAPSYAFTQRGRNIPALWMSSQFGKSVFQGSKAFTSKDTFMCEQIDFLNVLKRQVGFFKWFIQYVNASHVFFSWKDVKPFFYYHLEMAKLLFRKIGAKK